MSAEVGQPLDSLDRQPASASLDGAPGDDTVRRDLRQRHQHEGALEQTRVRQCQLRFVDRHVVIGDQVEVEGARAPTFFLGTVAAELFLDFVQGEQQRMGIEAGLDFDAGVDKTVLLLSPHGGVE